jgi:SAM-dependent methyltransferase
MDWQSVWVKEHDCTSRRRLDEKGFWDGRAESYHAAQPFKDDITSWQMSILDLDADDSCIDIGCGCGRLSIPAATVCRQVVALDGSPEMIRILRQDVEAEGLDNVLPVGSHFQDYIPDRSFDLAFASFSMFMRDMDVQLSRMNGCSDRCVVFASDSLRIPKAAQEMVFGREVSAHTDSEMILGIAEDLGYNPTIVRRTFDRDPVQEDGDAVLDRLAEMFEVDRDDPGLRSYVESEERRRDAGQLKIGAVSWKRRVRREPSGRSGSCTSAGWPT